MGNKILSVSFDFDGTLSEKPMQELAKKYLELGAEVFICTSRATKMQGGIPFKNNDLFQLADFLGIKRKNIIFTAFEDKYQFVKDFDMHYDDSDEEIFLINEYPNTKCIGFLYQHNYNNSEFLKL